MEMKEVATTEATDAIEPIETTPCAELSAFQRDILAVLARDGPVYGLAVKNALEEARDEPVNHGRLYPNLDTMIEMGLVEKSERDGRTNEYALTNAGSGKLRLYQNWLTNCLEASDV